LIPNLQTSILSFHEKQQELMLYFLFSKFGEFFINEKHLERHFFFSVLAS
jgi:hypothetical protein